MTLSMRLSVFLICGFLTLISGEEELELKDTTVNSVVIESCGG